MYDASAAAAEPPPSLDAVETLVANARDALLAVQRPDGHFVFELEADCTIPSEFILLKHYLGEPEDLELERKIGSTCAASRARTAAGRSTTTAPSTSPPASRPTSA